MGEKPVSFESQLQQFEITLQRGQYKRSSELVRRTLNLVEKYVQGDGWKSASDLIEWLYTTRTRLMKAAMSETAPSNIILRLVKMVQEEFTFKKKGKPTGLVSQISEQSEKVDYNEIVPDLREDIQTTIRELLFDLESSADNIAEDAEKHIHSNEVVLTLGLSQTVEAFLKRAAKQATFEVIVSECAPFCQGHKMAKRLSGMKIQTTLITDATIFAMMSRVNKVIIGTHTVMANGGLKAVAGSHLVALAAKYYNVPVIVLAPLYKLSPVYPRSTNIKISNRLVSPESLVDYSESICTEKAQICNPIFDYVPPELVSLFIFNIGSHAPSYIYRLLHETYPLMSEDPLVDC
jgi:translation initiation factor eIF-2B subunit beta